MHTATPTNWWNILMDDINYFVYDCFPKWLSLSVTLKRFIKEKYCSLQNCCDVWIQISLTVNNGTIACSLVGINQLSARRKVDGMLNKIKLVFGILLLKYFFIFHMYYWLLFFIYMFIQEQLLNKWFRMDDF